MFWECAETIASEMYPFRIPGVGPSGSSCVKTPADPPVDDAIKLWQDLIIEYSRGRLTVSSDKLIAISGIAREFHVSRKLKSEEVGSCSVIDALGLDALDSPQPDCLNFWDDDSATLSKKLTAPRAVLMASHMFARTLGPQA